VPRPADPALLPALILALILALGLGGGPLLAADAKPQAPDSQLKEIERAMEQGRREQERLKQRSETLMGELARLQADMVLAARAAQEQEDMLTQMEIRLGELRTQDVRKSATLEKRRDQMGGVLMALERLAWRPSEALLAQPANPADTVRTALLLRAAVPQIEDEARSLRREIDQLGAVRADIARQRQRMSQAHYALAGEQRRMEGQVRRKAELASRTEAERTETAKRLERLALEAEDLKDLIARIEEERRQRLAEAAAKAAAEAKARAVAKAAAKAQGRPPPPEPPREKENAAAQASPHHYEGPAKPFSQAKGTLPMPARGQLVERFGESTQLGPAAKGLRIETRMGAQVISPYDGQVVFAGPFRGYGPLLIIEHGEGYHTLLAGMGRIDGVVGQTVLAGEPVGIMGEAADGKPILYVELRRNGQPVNPLPWLAAQKDKVSG
jgi:septal ring factor EnvC (AmiA/AmiB activator)